MSDAVARWIMDRAAANAPEGRELWLRAMQGEFEALASGRLNWAVGCWMAMAGWKLRQDWLFFGALFAVPVLLESTVYPALTFAAALTLPLDVFRATFLPLRLGLMVLTAVGLAAWRPAHRRKAALAAAIMPLMLSVLLLWQMSPDGKHFGSDFQIMNTAPIVGMLALAGACWAGAWLGAWIGRHSRRFFSAT
jgi:hypothetical protein